MKPLKSAFPIANWLLRLTPGLLIYIFFKNEILTWNFENVYFLLVLGIGVFSFLLVIGGFLTKQTLTVLSGLLIMILSLVWIILQNFELIILGQMLIFFVIGFYFLSYGNKYTT